MIYLAAICGITLGVVTGLAVFAVGHVTTAWEVERAEWMRERADLLQRIQAPQAAVIDHHYRDPESYSPPAVDMTDEGDEEFWEAKEAMAERLARAEVNSG